MNNYSLFHVLCGVGIGVYFNNDKVQKAVNSFALSMYEDFNKEQTADKEEEVSHANDK